MISNFFIDLRSREGRGGVLVLKDELGGKDLLPAVNCLAIALLGLVWHMRANQN